MPITPDDANLQRNKHSVDKLCRIIDTKLIENSDPYPFIFEFKRDTPPIVIYALKDQYEGDGWSFEIKENEDKSVYTLSLSPKNRCSYNDVREDIRARALLSTDGREALRKAMIEPITISLMYQCVTRKLVMTLGCQLEPLKPIKNATWIKTTATVSGDNSIYTIDTLQAEVKDLIQSYEESSLFYKLKEHTTKQQFVIGTYSETVFRAIDDTIGIITTNKVLPAKIIMRPELFYKIIQPNTNFFKDATSRDILMTGLYGHYRHLDIHLTNDMPDNTIYVLGQATMIGSLKGNGENNEVYTLSNLQTDKGTISIDVDIDFEIGILDNAPVWRIDVRF